MSVACSGGGSADTRSNAGGAGHVPCTGCGQAGTSSGGADGGEGGADGEPDGGGDAGAAGAPIVLPLDGARISEISFWQALRVPLEVDGVEVARNAPVILNKEGILRVYVATEPQFEARALSAVLSVGVGSNVQAFESKKLIAGDSRHGEFSSTFNFPLGAAEVLKDTAYAVTLTDSSDGIVLDRFPEHDRSALGAEALSPANALKLTIVPMIVGGVAPDTSASALSIYRARLRAMYPLADVTITTHDAVTSSIKVGPDAGWDELLDSLYALRANDAPAPNVFYYGLFTPTKTFDDYCVTDCTVGYSVVASLHSEEDRGSIGLGIFSDGSNSDAPDTMAHELGHALGREHAPCDTTDPGPFPYKGGKLGSWGFDPLNHSLLDPQLYGDVMGYCTPDWVSDFTYRALFKRLASVNAEGVSAKSLQRATAATAYRRVLVHRDGSLAWGSRFTSRRAPEGETREVVLLAAHGSELGSVAASVRHLGDAPGAFLSVPEAAFSASAGVVAIRVGNAVLALPTP